MKIRIIDQRNKKKFQMDDEYIDEYGNLCGWKATLVYVCLCRRSNKEQSCWPSISGMAKQQGVSRDTIIDGIKALEQWNIIHIQRTKIKKKNWQNNRYTLLDKSVWKPKGVAGNTDNPSRQEQLNPVANTDSKDTHMQGNLFKDVAEQSSAIWSKEAFIKTLEESKDRKLNIIALYFEYKPPIVTNEEQSQVELKRWLKAGKNLEPFEDARIAETMHYLNKYATFKWTLETVIKYITQDLQELKSNSNAQNSKIR